MSTTSTTSTADVLRRGIQGHDAEALAALYDADATIEIVDAVNSPSRPRRLTGRDEIEAFLRDLYARDMRHEVDLVVGSPDALAYAVRCAYPDGTRVLCSAIGELRDGRIAREVVVQAWDA
jgi:hypothetical protein